MPIKPDKIDTDSDDPWVRLKKLKEIAEEVISETDPEDSKKDKRKRILWHFLYIMWHESLQGKKRVQGGGGPGRGLMQFEAATVHDLLVNGGLLNNAEKIKNLGKAAGMKEADMKAALQDFVNKNGGTNTWPKTTPASKIEELMKTNDTFGIKLMRYQYMRYGAQKFPPHDGDKTKDCKSEGLKEEHAEDWADWWKKKFDDDDDKKDKKDIFKGNAKHLDGVDTECTEKAKEKEESEEKPKKPTEEKTSEDKNKKKIKPPCFIATAVYGETSDEVTRLRKYRDEKLKTTLKGRIFISVYYAISPKIIPILNRSSTLRNGARKLLNKIIGSIGDE